MICHPAIWDSVADVLIFPNTPIPNIQPYRHVMWVIMENNHWMLAECYKSDRQAQFFITAPPNSAGRLLPMIQHLRTALACQNQDFMLHCLDQIHMGHVVGTLLLRFITVSASRLLHCQPAKSLNSRLPRMRNSWQPLFSRPVTRGPEPWFLPTSCILLTL